MANKKKTNEKKQSVFEKKNISVRTIESWVTLCGKYEWTKHIQRQKF